MTRAQSQIVAVGDAVALCSYGQCSKVWKGLVKECIEKRTVTPESLTLEEIKQAVCDQSSWSRGSLDLDEDGSDTDSWFSDAESLNADDPILQELLDESKDVLVTVSDEGLLNVATEASAPQSSRQEYVNFSLQTMKEYLSMHPNVYKRCELIKEGFDKASAFTLDDFPPATIQIRGRVHCGMAFTGDQVLVEVLQSNSARAVPDGGLHGKVVGVLKNAGRNRTFICTVDEFDLRVMIPIDHTVTKIFVPGLKDEPDVIPIRTLEKSGKIKLRTCKRVTQESKKRCLFAVQIVNWREGFYYPLGIVTELLPVASTLEEGLRVLDVEYFLTRQYPPAVNNEVDRIASGQFGLAKGSRRDCRAYPTFTVDPPGARDLDDAISVRDLGEEYEIGVHIADVASVVPKGCALDTEAKNRGASYYAPGREPVGMFPSPLSQDLCSLLPQKDRDVISLFILVGKKTDQVVKGFFTVSTICSDQQLTYEEAEGIIQSRCRAEAPPALRFETLEDCIAVAYHFSRVHRAYRLQDDCYYDQLDKDIPLGQRFSHQMVQEFMIMFNSFVGEFLTNKGPTRNLTPLRCQVEPNPQQMSGMRRKYRDLIPLSTHLSHHLRAQAPEVPPEAGGKFVLLTALWDHLRSAASARDFPKMLDIITTDDIHPKLAPVNLEFRKLLGRSYFLRSNSSTQSKAGHYSLHVDSYTWASSPIRRYLDIVVQRQIISVLSKKPVPYSPADIEVLCHDFNRKNGLAGAYEKRAHSLQMAVQLKNQVQQKVAFVMNVEAAAKSFKALFPLNKESIPDPHVIPYRALQLVAQPVLIEGQNTVKLVWRRRIYSMTAGKECTPKYSRLQDKSVSLVSAQAWCSVLAAIRNKDFEKIISLLEKGQSTQLRSMGTMRRSKCSHFAELELELSAGGVLHLQLTSDVQRGFLNPLVQLWTVTPGFDVCLEHTGKPIDCFSKYATQASKELYVDARAYRKVWLPLLDMEAVSCAVSENDSIVLHDVKIVWEKKRTKKGQLQGTLPFTRDFLKQCAIEVDFSYCYLCIRLSGLKVDHVPDDAEALSHSLQNLSLTKEKAEAGKLLVDPATYTWVAHGRTEEYQDNEKNDQRGELLVHFHTHFMSMEKVPAEVTQESSRFTVELIPELLPDV